ncbi:MAG TPA: FAD-linked oxidase C-terminal domain-containing protein [Candidatus Tectomicrobia bacterium]|nr:FAD-linked oxidase C-terminal domain-containing protein [Candidatus Tectomicrobia bacterium]
MTTPIAERVPLAADRKAALRRELEGIVGRGAVLADPDELLVYESDGLTLFRALADFVVFPTSTAHVAEIVRLADRERLPFVARGAGTGLSGGCLPAEGGIVISMMRMNRVLEVDYDNQIAVVEPGLVNLHLSWAVAPRGFYYAPDPSSQQACTVGGNIANNSGGPHTLKYGVTVNHVLGLEVVLPDGEVAWLGGRTRDALGYDLAGVFVGSEGTFGIATKIVVRILRKPQAVRTVLAVFERIEDASAAVSAIIARGLVPAAVEMIDQLTIQAVEDAFGCGYPRDAAAAVLIELDGLRAGMDAQAERIVAACRESGARDVRAAADEAERQLLWKGRKSAFGAYGRVSPAYMVMDGVIPRTRLPYVLGRVNEIVAAHGLRVGNVFHAGDGNLHPNILYDPRVPGEEARVVEAGAAIMRVCAEVGGSISGEHGIGLEKADFMPFIFSPADLAFMERLRAAFNPSGLCNPGKMFPTRKSCGEVGAVAYRPHAIEERGLAQRF